MVTRVIRFDENGGQEGFHPTEFLDRSTIVAGNPEEKGRVFYANPQENILAGVWECTAGTMEIESFPYDEFVEVLEGSIEITDTEGHREVFKAGETFMIPKGMKLTWHMPETLKEYFMVYIN